MSILLNVIVVRLIVYGENAIDIEVNSYWKLFIEEVHFLFVLFYFIYLQFHYRMFQAKKMSKCLHLTIAIYSINFQMSFSKKIFESNIRLLCIFILPIFQIYFSYEGSLDSLYFIWKIFNFTSWCLSFTLASENYFWIWDHFSPLLGGFQLNNFEQFV